MRRAIAFLPPVLSSTSVAEPESRLRTLLAQLEAQRAKIDDKIAQINEWLREIETERAERGPPPAKWWYPV